jgi:hypothetical protein
MTLGCMVTAKTGMAFVPVLASTCINTSAVNFYKTAQHATYYCTDE